MNDKPIFIDGIKKVNFISGTIRMEMFYRHPTEYDEENNEDAGELVMTVDGFISVMNSMQRIAEMLVERGMLRRGERQESEISGNQTDDL